jgi:hypothetical protein
VRQRKSEAMTIPEAEDFRSAFARFREQLESHRKEDRVREANEAPGFNLFRLLSCESDEVRTHSALLAELLSPEGSHGQGEIFLEEFLREVGETQDLDWLAEPPEADDWTVNTEEWFSDGRLDVVVRSGVTPLLLVIENKIYAADAEDQLQRYERWMGCQPGHSSQKIYLTLDGKACKGTPPAKYCRLSYRENIVQWLTRSQKRVGAAAVRDVCGQYLNTIAMLCGGIDMKNSENKSQVDMFLLEPENYRFAVKVHERFAKLIDELIKEFWRRLRARVREDPRAQGWNASIRWESSAVKDWCLDAVPGGSAGNYVRISAVEDDSGFKYGIVWMSGAQHPLPRPPLDEDLPFRLPEGEWKSNPWWVAYRVVLNTRLNHNNFWQRTPQEQLQKADEIAFAVCALIESAGDFVRSKEIEAANREPKAAG